MRLNQYPLGEQEQLAALSLWSRDRAGTPPPERAARFPQATAPGVVLHRATWTEAELQTRHGFAVTDAQRTLRDLVAFLPSDVLEAVVVQARELGLL